MTDQDPSVIFAAMMTKLKQECEAQHARAEQAEAEVERLREDNAAMIDVARVAQVDVNVNVALRERAEAEVERLDDRVNILTKMLRYIAFIATGDESGDPQLGVDRLRQEVERLRAEVERYRQANDWRDR